MQSLKIKRHHQALVAGPATPVSPRVLTGVLFNLPTLLLQAAEKPAATSPARSVPQLTLADGGL